MRNFTAHRRALTWIAGLATAATVATAGAGAVLAEDPACIGQDGQPVTYADAADTPSLCDPAPAPAPEPAQEPAPEPAPPAPAPAPEPAPTVTPAPPSDAAPVDPSPAPPAPTGDGAAPQPPATEPAPPATDGGGTAPTPAAPTTEPAATTPQPAAPAPEPTAPTPAPPDPTTGTPAGTAPPSPVAPQPAKPATATPERAAPPVVVRRTHALLRAKQSQAGAFSDARLFRERFTPAGRIPQQPNLATAQATQLFTAAEGTGTSWSTLAAVAWLDTRWGGAATGGTTELLGERLSAAQWRSFRADGDGDGAVSRSSTADQARAVAKLIAASPQRAAGLRAYFAAAPNASALARRATFLADYFDALGPEAIVAGLEDPTARKDLADRVLADEDIEVYAGGRSDIEAGLIDPRLLVTMRFLANRFGTVTISSMISGHGVYTAGGNVSLHSYGQAIDVAALGGETILGHQGAGSRTHRAVKELLLLPEAMQSAELISLWDMGMPSFAAADHHDHIHVGFKTVTESEARASAATQAPDHDHGG